MDNTTNGIDLDQNKIFKLLSSIGTELSASAQESIKFIQGNNSAGTRVRKAMQKIKTLAQEVRVEVQTQKNEAPV